MPRADVATGSSRGSHGRHGRAAILAAVLLAAVGCGDGSPPAATAPERACSDCHPALDHAGRFSVLAHRTTASGEPFRCRDCHGEQFGAVTSATCLACHRDAAPGFVGGHVEAWGPECLACHDGARFTGPFDHGTTGWPLEGRHRGVACGSCHDPSGWEAAAHGFAVVHDHPADPGCEVCHPDAPAGYATYSCYGCHRHRRERTLEEHLDADVSDVSDDCMRCHSL